MTTIHIDKIVNGFVITSFYDKQPSIKTFHKDMTSVVQHLHGVYVYDKTLDQIKREAEDELRTPTS